MMKLTKTPILPNYKAPNDYFFTNLQVGYLQLLSFWLYFYLVSFFHERKSERKFKTQNPIPSPHCVKNFPSKQTMLDHILVIHEGKKYHCQFCAKTFNHKCNMQSHVNRVHEGKKPKPAICSQCDKVFTRSNALKRHIRETCMKEKRRLL